MLLGHADPDGSVSRRINEEKLGVRLLAPREPRSDEDAWRGVQDQVIIRQKTVSETR